MPATKPSFPRLKRSFSSVSSWQLFKGLEVAWPFYEGGGLLLNDLVAHKTTGSGEGSVGTLTGGATWSKGQHGNCLNFDGSSGYVSVGNLSTLNFEFSDMFSFALWYKVSTVPATNTILFSKMLGAGLFTGYAFHLNGAAGGTPYQLDLIFNDGSGLEAIAQFAHTADTNWHHVVICYSGTGTVAGMTCYEDGVALSKSVAADNLQSNSILTTNEFQIGARTSSSTFFTGLIDSLMVWGRVLSQAEVSALYADTFQIFRPIRKDWFKTSGAGPAANFTAARARNNNQILAGRF